MLKVNYYQVYNNGVGDLIVTDKANKENNRRRGIPRGAIEPDGELTVSGASQLEALRRELIGKHTTDVYPDVAVMFNTTLM